jgi:hypothetical protein
MADVEWQPLPALWPEPAAWTDVGELMLVVLTQDGVPTWEVNRRAKAGSGRDDLITSGIADTFEAAKGSRTLRSKDAVPRMRCTVTHRAEDVTSPYRVRPVTFSIADLRNFDA